MFKVVWFSRAEESADCYVVIDVFRATSFMVTALALGAKKIIPAQTTKEAFQLKEQTKEKVLLAGESRTKSIRGFDMNNSPSALDESIKGKTIVHRTSAGTKVIRALMRKNVLIGSVLNASAVKEKMEREGYTQVCLVCCGLEAKEFALEDLYGAGCIAEPLKPANDFAILAKRVKEEDVMACSGAKRLKEHGFEKDIGFCLQKDAFDVCPVLKNGAIAL
ncbi:MAG: 2-phosphosulfolactate phosphatase [Candidatus Thermoplasmatota archaeon]|nr:2-phosphosulfolactate phosphatase [Candidatus Thermoplasmatota archaeon]